MRFDGMGGLRALAGGVALAVGCAAGPVYAQGAGVARPGGTGATTGGVQLETTLPGQTGVTGATPPRATTPGPTGAGNVPGGPPGAGQALPPVGAAEPGAQGAGRYYPPGTSAPVDTGGLPAVGGELPYLGGAGAMPYYGGAGVMPYGGGAGAMPFYGGAGAAPYAQAFGAQGPYGATSPAGALGASPYGTAGGMSAYGTTIGGYGSLPFSLGPATGGLGGFSIGPLNGLP